MQLRGVGTKIANTVSLFKPSKNGLCSSNTGLRAVIYGKKNNNSCRLGLFHLLTAARFRKEILEARYLSGDCSEAAIQKMSGIMDSIPKSFRGAFYDVKYLDEFMHSPIVEKMADLAARIRKGYDKYMDRPIAKVKSGAYFALHNTKQAVAGLFKSSKANDVDLDFVKQVFPGFVKIPEGASNAELKEFLIKTLKRCNYSDKEINAVLERKNPVFYRFVDETELRAIKNGKKITSAADYNVDLCHTDVTTDPNYRGVYNKYRITFKIKPEWNPFQKGGSNLIESNDMTQKTWKLFGGYDKNDILCTERVHP